MILNSYCKLNVIKFYIHFVILCTSCMNNSFGKSYFETNNYASIHSWNANDIITLKRIFYLISHLNNLFDLYNVTRQHA